MVFIGQRETGNWGIILNPKNLWQMQILITGLRCLPGMVMTFQRICYRLNLLYSISYHGDITQKTREVWSCLYKLKSCLREQGWALCSTRGPTRKEMWLYSSFSLHVMLEMHWWFLHLNTFCLLPVQNWWLEPNTSLWHKRYCQQGQYCPT